MKRCTVCRAREFASHRSCDWARVLGTSGGSTARCAPTLPRRPSAVSVTRAHVRRAENHGSFYCRSASEFARWRDPTRRAQVRDKAPLHHPLQRLNRRRGRGRRLRARRASSRKLSPCCAAAVELPCNLEARLSFTRSGLPAVRTRSTASPVVVRRGRLPLAAAAGGCAWARRPTPDVAPDHADRSTSASRPTASTRRATAARPPPVGPRTARGDARGQDVQLLTRRRVARVSERATLRAEVDALARVYPLGNLVGGLVFEDSAASAARRAIRPRCQVSIVRSRARRRTGQRMPRARACSRAPDRDTTCGSPLIGDRAATPRSRRGSRRTGRRSDRGAGQRPSACPDLKIAGDLVDHAPGHPVAVGLCRVWTLAIRRRVGEEASGNRAVHRRGCRTRPLAGAAPGPRRTPDLLHCAPAGLVDPPASSRSAIGRD